MTDLILIEEFRQYLTDQGIVRADNMTPGSAPPCWLNPQDGPRQPAGNDTAAVTLRQTGQMPTGHLNGFLEEEVIEVVVRARHSKQGELLQRVIRGSVNDRSDFMLGQLRVQWCLMWRGPQPVPLLPGAVSKSWDTTQSFLFQVRTADLTV